jgi:hypothetical protein
MLANYGFKLANFICLLTDSRKENEQGPAGLILSHRGSTSCINFLEVKKCQMIAFSLYQC